MTKHDKGKVNTDVSRELIMYMDSNSRFLNFRKLWTPKGTKIKNCGNLNEVNLIIGGNRISESQICFYQCGMQ